MKTRLLLALVPLLLGGCASKTITLVPAPAVLRANDPATITVTLRDGAGAPWNFATQVTLTTSDPAAVFTPTPAPPSGPQKHIFTTASYVSTDNIVAGIVDHDTPVTIDGKMRVALETDPTSSVVVTVLPPLMESPQHGDKYITVAPSIVPEWTFTYVITAMCSTAGGAPPNLAGCTMSLERNAVVTATAISSMGNPLSVSVTVLPNNTWYLYTGPTFQSMTITVVPNLKKTVPGGTASFSCHGADGNDYVSTASGPTYGR